jgi:PTS system mannose-specific IIB component/fructoselysine and glucoselysine-specific PTS system IIB component
MRLLAERTRLVDRVNIGGLHHRPGRVERLRYVFVTPDEEAGLRAIEASGVPVTAQDVPTAPEVPLSAILASTSAS